MTNNDILRRFRYALDISNATMLRTFSLAGQEVDQATLMELLKKEGEEGYRECDPLCMEQFLEGLIILKRGRMENATVRPAHAETEFTNNDILRKLRIALELKEDDMIAIMNAAGVTISKSELSALFRAKGHKNYKACGDQFLRNFLKGLTIRTRNIIPEEN